MKKMLLLAGAAVLCAVSSANAQEAILIQDEEVVEVPAVPEVVYHTNWNNNWFIEVGAGFNLPFVENATGADRHFTANYGVGFGKWFSPYFGWRAEFSGGSIHWNNWHHPVATMAGAKTINANVDIMWDMFNSIGGVNDKRVFSIVPFVGVGGTFNWKYKNLNMYEDYIPKHDCLYPTYEGKNRNNEWLLPVSAGIQLRFRLCKYVDFFAQARASFYGDSYNNVVVAYPVDVNLSALGGLTFNLGGRGFNAIPTGAMQAETAILNDKIEQLHTDIITYQQQAAELQRIIDEFNCPPIPEPTKVPDYDPLLGTVRFNLNSATILPTEEVNIYNLAEWMKKNDANITITGYADKDTGSGPYNLQLSEKRANAVSKALVKYGINPNRIKVEALGSEQQPYPAHNSWNRIVTFTLGK